MRRREFMTLLGGAAAWPLVARAQPPARMRRLGVLVSLLPAEDPRWQARGTGFTQGLQELGWSVGRNLSIDFRFGLANVDRLRRSAEELVARAPDALFAAAAPATTALRHVTSTLPIVFVNVPDPVGAGYVHSLARPSGNITGFMNIEYRQSGKWLELLKQIAPHVTRAAVLRTEDVEGASQFAAIQSVASFVGIEVTPIGVRSEAEIERAISDFVRIPNGGLVMTSGVGGTGRRELIVALAARYRLPAVYSGREYVNSGGLICYGVDVLDLYRRSAGYVDRILRGDKPGDLPVQAPTKYETVLNLKTAKTLGLQVPDVVRLRADEVIE
jgi:putative tryptophan/tyrosine transport system substrate-binding protein